MNMTRHLSIPKRAQRIARLELADWYVSWIVCVCIITPRTLHHLLPPSPKIKEKWAPHHFPLIQSLFLGYTPQQLAWGTLSTIGSIFRSHVTLSETGSSLQKIVFFCPQKGKIHHLPTSNHWFLGLCGSFREGSFRGVESIPWPTWRRFPLHDRWVKAKRSRVNCERRIWFGRNTNSTMEIRRIAGFYGSSSEKWCLMIFWAFGMGNFLERHWCDWCEKLKVYCHYVGSSLDSYCC